MSGEQGSLGAKLSFEEAIKSDPEVKKLYSDLMLTHEAREEMELQIKQLKQEEEELKKRRKELQPSEEAKEKLKVLVQIVDTYKSTLVSQSSHFLFNR